MLLPKCRRINHSDFMIYFMELGMDPKSEANGSDTTPVDGE